MAAFHWHRPIRFRDCDPAGIVFYPRFFEMTNDLVETFFDEAIGWSFGRMHGEDGLGVPMGAIQTRFEAPARLGDRIDWRLAIARLGGASADLSIVAAGEGIVRLRTTATIVLVDIAEMKSRRWPEEIRARLSEYVEESAA